MNDIIREILLMIIGNETTIQMLIVDSLFYVITIIVSIVMVIIVIKVFIYLNHFIMRRYIKQLSEIRVNTIISLTDNLIKYSLAAMGIFIVLINLGFDAKVVLTGAGAGAVIIGIAAQELIKDFINGVFTVIEGYYDIGDYIEVNAYSGTVVDLGIKTTTLRTDENYVVTIPNSLITEIKNFSKSDINIFYEISTSYESDVKKNKEVIINEILPIFLKDNMVISAEYRGVQHLNESSVNHMVCIVCKPIDRYQVKRNMNLIIKEQFERKGIEIPYNKITVYEGSNG